MTPPHTLRFDLGSLSRPSRPYLIIPPGVCRVGTVGISRRLVWLRSGHLEGVMARL